MTDHRTYTIGDIHGCLPQLEALLKAIDEDANGRPHQIITLGDYMDRGPNSKGVLDLLMTRPDIVRLRGNHEVMFMEAVSGGYSELNFFCTHGGRQTMASFGVEHPQEIEYRYKAFIRETKMYHEDARRIYVHAGISHRQPDMAKQNPDHLLWIREGFLDVNTPFPKYVVHGHTPQDTGEPDIRNNRTNCDSGCFFTGNLTAAVFDDSQDKPIGTLIARGPVVPWR